MIHLSKSFKMLNAEYDSAFFCSFLKLYIFELTFTGASRVIVDYLCTKSFCNSWWPFPRVLLLGFLLDY